MDYMQELFTFLQMDTTSAKSKGREAASFLADLMKEAGVGVEIVEGSVNPFVIGEIDVKADKTLLIYNHYDVQPVEPLNKWDTDPFEPTIKEGRIYARGVADDKGALLARLQGIRELIKENRLRVNLKFLYEGEEEIGSPNIKGFLTKYKERLKANYVLWEGAGRGVNGAPQVILGVKGLLYVEITSRTPKDLHSMYAPIARNPAWEIVRLLSGLRDERGRVKLSGFYDKVIRLSEKEREFAKFLSRDEMERALGQKVGEDFALRLVEEPTCNIDGIEAGYTGPGSKTVIPSQAFVKIDFRLVPEQRPEELLESLRNYLRDFDVELKVYGMEEPHRTPFNTEIARAVRDSAKEVYGVEPLVIPNSPGTGPMASVSKILGTNQIADGVGPDRPDSNIHSFNENVVVEDYLLTIRHMKALLRLLSSH